MVLASQKIINCIHESPTKSMQNSRVSKLSPSKYDNDKADVIIEQTHMNQDKKKIPLYVWNNRGACTYRTACIEPNGDVFGVIPLTNLRIYAGPEIMWDNTLDILQAHKLIHKTVVPNLLNARITVKIQLKLIRWQHHLSTYLDEQIPALPLLFLYKVSYPTCT